jgi:hypothetical protein
VLDAFAVVCFSPSTQDDGEKQTTVRATEAAVAVVAVCFFPNRIAFETHCGVVQPGCWD